MPEGFWVPNNKYRNYLVDLGELLKEYSNDAISDYIASKGSSDEQFKSGYMMALSRVVDLMQQQAESFDISLSEINLHNIKESDFLK